MKKLNHPNVVKLVEVLDQENDDAIYLVMEYVGQFSVQQLMKKEKLWTGSVWKFFRDALRGLLYWHEEAKVVHRDIKPENLLLTKNKTVKIADFGCSAIIQNGSKDLENTVGSNYFFSPEITKGDDKEGKPSDVWALGVTLYLMLYNEYPFQAPGNEYQKLYNKIQNEEPYYPEDAEDKDPIDLLKKIFIKVSWHCLKLC